MKIAISSTGKTLEDNVDMRFGRCPYFLIVDIEDEEVKDVKAVENPNVSVGGGAGVSAGELVGNEKVKAVITINLGPKAMGIMQQLGIEVYKGEGKIKDVVKKFIAGKLEKVSDATGPQHMGLK